MKNRGVRGILRVGAMMTALHAGACEKPPASISIDTAHTESNMDIDEETGIDDPPPRDVFAWLSPDSNESAALDRAAIRVMEDRLYDRFKNNEDFKVGLRESLDRMQPHMTKMEEIFDKHHVPRRYIYLSVLESRFRPGIKSRSGAVGVFQIMPKSNERFGTPEGDLSNVEYNAEVAARMLADAYAYFGDWDLALAGYHGGFAWRYAKEERKKGMTYDGFLTFLTSRIDKRKGELTQSRDVQYQVKGGDTLSRIASVHRVAVDTLKKHNHLTSDNIRVGDHLIIPLDAEAYHRYYTRELADLQSNVEYVPYFSAICRLLADCRSSDKS